MTQGGIDGVATALGARLAAKLPQVQVVTEYPFHQRKMPAEGTLLWLGIEKIAVAAGGLDPYLGESSAQGGTPGAAQYGRRLELGIRLELLDRYDGAACHRIFSQLCQILLLEESPLRLGQLSCGELTFEREAGAFRLVCKGSLGAWLTTGEEAAEITGGVVTRRGL